MTIGDRVRLHISPGYRDALGLPEKIGVVRAIDNTGDRAAILVHFDGISVYVSTAENEVEIVEEP